MEKSFNGQPMNDPTDYLSRAFAAMLLDRAKVHNYRNYMILLLLLRTGRRISELLKLKPKDINYEQGLVLWNIEKKKNKPKVWKSLDRETLQLLRDYIERTEIQSEEYVFFSPYKGRDHHISRIAVYMFLQLYAKELNIDVHPHTFRHTFAVWVAEQMTSPADLKKLKDILEHSDTKMTEFYLQFSPKETKNLLEKTFLDYDKK